MISEKVYQKNYLYYKNLLIRKFGVKSVNIIDQILMENTKFLKNSQNYKKFYDLVKEATKNIKEEKQVNKPLDKHILKMQSLINPSKRNLSKDKQNTKKKETKRKPLQSHRQLQNYNTLTQTKKQNNENLKQKIKQQVDAQNQKIKQNFNRSQMQYQKSPYDKNFLAKIEKFLKIDDKTLEQNLTLSSIEKNVKKKHKEKKTKPEKKPKKLIKKFLNTSQKNTTQVKKFSEICKELEMHEQKNYRASSRSFIDDLKEMKNLSNSFVSQELFEVDKKTKVKNQPKQIKNKFKQNVVSMRKLVN